MPNLPHSNPPGYRPPSIKNTLAAPIRLNLATGTAADRPRRPGDPEEADDYDPFALLDQHGTTVAQSHGNLDFHRVIPQQPIGGMVPINGHAVDTDPNGGLHTSKLVTGNLKGGPTPVGGTAPTQVTQVTTSGHLRGGRTQAVAQPSPGAPAENSGADSAISDGTTTVAVPTRGADGKQDGWEYLTPDQANWKANFGHLPGTPGHPTTPQVQGMSFPQAPPAAPVRVASGAGVGGTGLPHDVAVELDQAHRQGTGTNYTLPPGGYGKTWQGTPSAPPVVPLTHNADGTPVAAPKPAVPMLGAAGSLANLSGNAPQLPATNFPTVPGTQPTGAAFNPGAVAPAPRLALNTGAPTPAPSTLPVGFTPPTIPQSTVAGSGITAEQLRTPQPTTPGVQAQTEQWAKAVATNGASDRPAPSLPAAPKVFGQDATADQAGQTALGGLQNTYAGIPDALTSHPLASLEAHVARTNATPAVTTNTAPATTSPGFSTSTTGTTANSATSGGDFPKSPVNPFATPKTLDLAGTATASNASASIPLPKIPDPDELKKKLAASGGV